MGESGPPPVDRVEQMPRQQETCEHVPPFANQLLRRRRMNRREWDPNSFGAGEARRTSTAAHRLDQCWRPTHEHDAAPVAHGTGDPAAGVPYHAAEVLRLVLARAEDEPSRTRDLMGRLRSGDLDPWASPASDGA
jgi:hypothetical protein